MPNNAYATQKAHTFYIRTVCHCTSTSVSMYGTVTSKPTGAPAVCFENDAYVDDTEDDDVSLLLLRRKLAELCLLSAIEDD